MSLSIEERNAKSRARAKKWRLANPEKHRIKNRRYGKRSQAALWVGMRLKHAEKLDNEVRSVGGGIAIVGERWFHSNYSDYRFVLRKKVSYDPFFPLEGAQQWTETKPADSGSLRVASR